MLKRITILIPILVLTFSARAAFVAFEAESGALGADWASNGASPAYITITSNGAGNNPANSNRVATYTVTFPAAGTYQLYARLRVGAGEANDDSLFLGNGFGTKNPSVNGNWLLVNGLAGKGFIMSSDVVTGGGSVTSGVWKWINLSQLLGQSGFVVSAGNLTQTFQIGGREDGLDMDKFVFGSADYTFTVSNLDNGADGTPPPPPTCSIAWTNTQQRIDGFGFSSAWCGTLSAAKNNALYGTLGMSFLRIRIDPNGSWAEETANAAAAHARGLKVLGSEWTPPASMKSNNNPIGGSLRTNQYAAYATWLNQAANSIGLDYVSFQNEPDITVTYESCDWTPAQMLSFCRSNAAAIGRPVVMPESFNFNDAWSDPTLNDPIAVTNIAVVGGHFYGNGNRVHTNALAKGKPVWMTEHYLDGGRDDYRLCLNMAKEINDAMKNQFNAYIAWWAQDGDTNINLVNNNGTIFKDGYTIGQFAKFIRPGFYRVGTTNSSNSAEITAYKDVVSSNFVIIAINRGNTVITQQFNLSGFPALPISPWVTSHALSLALQPHIPFDGSTFTYSIQPSNIVTFVGMLPPSIPTDLTATPGKNKLNLHWNAVPGADTYKIKRATVSGGSYVALTNVSAANFSDTNVVIGSRYFYVVSAVNAGGESADSAEASAVALNFYSTKAIADAYVESSNANNNYGNLFNLIVRNNITNAARNIYLKFDVHGLTNLQSANLILVPNRVDDATVPIYYELSPTNWIESGINWNNQPGGTGAFFATNTVSVGVPVSLDVTSAAISQATNGGFLSIRITQPINTLNGLVQFTSRENFDSSSHPVIEYSYPANTPPTLAPLTNHTIGAGETLTITNSATDSDEPAQALTFSLLMSPTNATIDANGGVLTWRPLVTQADSTNPFTVMVADNGTPSLSATQNFVVTVNPLQQPVFSASSISGGQLVLQINGDAGPDYQVQSSTNLVDWSAVFTTNTPPMPFVWTNNIMNGPTVNFFRIQAGPPFP